MHIAMRSELSSTKKQKNKMLNDESGTANRTDAQCAMRAAHQLIA